ncbi:MAG: PstS family phosphate ABC transporter substrate-binding protein [Dehalococcoidales bacterium]|nr:PstS family phosphate ABC transporter substrate-binding protein [Dehalococcoidales bacterium]
MFKSKIKWFLAPALALAAILALAGCTASPTTTTNPTATGPAATTTASALSGSFKIIGSNTVTPLSSIWSENFMKANPKASIAVSGPGSGAGIAALIDGTTDVCQASRAIKNAEIEQAKAKGVNPYEIQVATDALSVVVNPANPINELTFAQLSAIYTNQITNWKEVGGNDAPIVVFSRDSNSGTFAYFLEDVVQMPGLPTANKELQYGGKVMMLPSTEEGISQVAGNPNAIFYCGLGYVNDSVKTLGIKKTPDDTAVQPSVENALNGTYPISRPLFYYTNGEPTGVIKAYIDYCLSEEGQEEVLVAGFVPLAK